MSRRRQQPFAHPIGGRLFLRLLNVVRRQR
jgi:hypothetical protein